ncbi:hypothetical protein SO802_024833, partial [Lithocarpus litseifolius]
KPLIKEKANTIELCKTYYHSIEIGKAIIQSGRPSEALLKFCMLFKQVKVLTVCQSRTMDSLKGEGEDSQEKEGRSYGSLMIQRLTGSEGQIDHMLQIKHLSIHTYKPLDHIQSSGGNSKEESGSTVWSDQRETVDEELPLTFSDTIMVRNFSRKAKKIWKKR